MPSSREDNQFDDIEMTGYLEFRKHFLAESTMHYEAENIIVKRSRRKCITCNNMDTFWAGLRKLGDNGIDKRFSEVLRLSLISVVIISFFGLNHRDNIEANGNTETVALMRRKVIYWFGSIGKEF